MQDLWILAEGLGEDQVPGIVALGRFKGSVRRLVARQDPDVLDTWFSSGLWPIGTLGWPEYAPYDRIMVTAGAPAVPEALVEQMADNGKLVIPVGDRFSQVLQILTKHKNRVETTTSCHCVFVKLIGKDGWSG